MRRKKKILSLIALLLIAVGVTSEVNTVTASAETPYKTYYGRWLRQNRRDTGCLHC